MINTLSVYRQGIIDALHAIDANQGAMLGGVNAWGEDLRARLLEFTARGKLIRGSLVLAAAEAFGAAPSTPAYTVAASVELVQSFLLIHDDIMDEDETRRGGPSVHTALARAHGEAKLGRDLAILAGDLASSLHEGLLANLDAPADRRQLVARVFAEMHLDVVHGQTLDLLGSASAEEVASRKTASYTTVGPLTAGAALGGADASQVVALAGIGRPLGVAFQIRDDLLGAFGEPDKTGKPVGTDLLRGKRTVLLERALARADDPQRAAIESVIGRPDANDEQLAAATAALIDCGAKAECEERISELVSTAIRSLEQGLYLARGRQLISELATALSRRET